MLLLSYHFVFVVLVLLILCIFDVVDIFTFVTDFIWPYVFLLIFPHLILRINASGKDKNTMICALVNISIG